MQIKVVEPSYQGKLQSLFIETYPECLFIMSMFPVHICLYFCIFELLTVLNIVTC